MYINIKSNIDSVVSNFQSISLDELENKNLLDRQDIKYIFNISKSPDILKELLDNYLILDINGYRIFNYDNIYFDTSNFYLYHLHHNGILNRFKIRRRYYLEANLFFLELKFNNNKDQTIKQRFKLLSDNLDFEPKLKNNIRYKHALDLDDFQPKLKICYHRITLVHKIKDEKITLDFDISFINGKDSISYDGIIIAEVKQKRKLFRNDFSDIMHNNHIKSTNLSKYCTGIMLTNPGIKHNRFKSKIFFINKIR